MVLAGVTAAAAIAPAATVAAYDITCSSSRACAAVVSYGSTWCLALQQPCVSWRAVRPLQPRRARGGRDDGATRPAQQARKALGWPKRCKVAHAFQRGCSNKGLKSVQLPGQLGVFLTTGPARKARWSGRATTEGPSIQPLALRHLK